MRDDSGLTANRIRPKSRYRRLTDVIRIMEGSSMQNVTQTNEKVRVFELENGNQVIATQRDPYGFWDLHLKHGQLPDRFQGHYSYWDAVVKDVERYKQLRLEAQAEP